MMRFHELHAALQDLVDSVGGDAPDAWGWETTTRSRHLEDAIHAAPADLQASESALCALQRWVRLPRLRSGRVLLVLSTARKTLVQLGTSR